MRPSLSEGSMDPTSPNDGSGPPPDSFHNSRGYRCGCGRYHLTVGPVTLNLTESELVLVGRTIHALAARRPDVHARLVAAVREDDADRRRSAGGDPAHGA